MLFEEPDFCGLCREVYRVSPNETSKAFDGLDWLDSCVSVVGVIIDCLLFLLQEEFTSSRKGDNMVLDCRTKK